ncbi:hypothetical protein BC827DRAFT_1155169 [Russula dissimulans]|nr:hypothetical protein BC827DRAFT_1155169 [Russula dissimulans]
MSDKTEVKGGEHGCDVQRDHLGTGGSVTFGSGCPGGICVDHLCVALSLGYNVGVLGVWWDCLLGGVGGVGGLSWWNGGCLLAVHAGEREGGPGGTWAALAATGGSGEDWKSRLQVGGLGNLLVAAEKKNESGSVAMKENVAVHK